jgi:hypothetical protein
MAWMAHDGQTRRSHPHVHGCSFKQLDAQLFFQVFDRHGQRRLSDTAGFGRTTKMFLSGQ